MNGDIIRLSGLFLQLQRTGKRASPLDLLVIIMRITLLDTMTGEIRIIDNEPYDAWWWAYGNGSCDCNREDFFGVHSPQTGICIGAHRFIISRVEDADTDYSLKEFNDDYPDELLKQHGIT